MTQGEATNPVARPPARADAPRRRRRRWGLVAAIVGGGLVCVLLVAVALLAPVLARNVARAQSLGCQGRLQHLALGVRIHAVNHDSRLPSDWSELGNEFANPALLVCPADKAHPPAASWQAVTPAHISYAYLGGGGNDDQTNRVLATCPVHGHVVVAGGRVYPGVMRRRGDAVSVKDGATWLDVSRLPGHEGGEGGARTE